MDELTATELLDFSKRLLMIAWMQGDSIGELVTGIADYFDRTKQFESWDRDKWMDRKSSLETILGTSSPLYVMAKAEALRQRYEALTTTSRVISDTRYIFDETANSIIGAFVSHSLVIEYLDADYSRKKHFFTLDSEEIDTLISQLQRARLKGLAISQTLTAGGVKDLTP